MSILISAHFTAIYKYTFKAKVVIVQLCPTTCDCMDCIPPGSSVHGILQARTLEWAAIPFFTQIPSLSL